MKRFLILAGYCQLSLYLYLSDKLDHYINAHYSYLVLLSAGLAFLLACVQLVIWVKTVEKKGKARWSFSLLSLPIIVGFLVPTMSLDATTVATKGYYLPLSARVDDPQQSLDGIDIQYLNPDTSFYFTPGAYRRQMTDLLKKYQGENHINIDHHNYMEVMELIYRYPNVFLGKALSYSGFVYRDPDVDGQQFLFRFGVIHCIADSGVYGLLTRGEDMAYHNNTWVLVSGDLTMTYHQSLKRYLPTLDVLESSAIVPPKNPYVYRSFY